MILVPVASRQGSPRAIDRHISSVSFVRNIDKLLLRVPETVSLYVIYLRVYGGKGKLFEQVIANKDRNT